MATRICLIYMPKPEGHRPEGEGIHIRQIPSGHGISNIYTTFTPHFNGKRRCISGIIALLTVLRNAVTRIGGSIYKLYPS